MARSLGLTLYNLAAPAGRGEERLTRPHRPAGSLIWLHAPGPDSLAAMSDLAVRLIEEDGVAVLLTAPLPAPLAGEAILQPPPLDSPRAAQDFLDHWRPDAAVLAEGVILPALIHEAGQRHLPLIMVEARAPRLPRGREGWFPGLIRQSLAAFAQVLALDEAAARSLRKAGVEADRLLVAGRMEEPSAALPHVERDRSALAEAMATRPVWLAADVAVEEEEAIIAAHGEALKLAHRLLLILVPADPDRVEPLVQRMEEGCGWRVACRRSDQEPDAETEVFLTGPAEYGLWYRLAPVTFLGGSLSGQGCARNPMEAAAMGSAILYGPRSGNWSAAYGRLGAARAARMVGSVADLTQALGDLLSPDRAARQAQAAWTIASEGAEATERVLQEIRALLDGAA